MRQLDSILGVTPAAEYSARTASSPAPAARWRQAAGVVCLLGFFVRAVAGGAARGLFLGRRFDARAKARWLQSLCRRAARVARLEVTCEGEPPASGLVVCNHLGYLDILALGSIAPLVFLSKREVLGWPVVGFITRLAGTLFVNRADKREAARLSAPLEDLAGGGSVVVIFPEGTSSDGKRVLPFRSALLEPAARGGWLVTPAWIGYVLDDGDVADEVCYWGDMTFVPHLLNLLGKKGARATVRFGPSIRAAGCRKELARALRAEVCRLGGLEESPAFAGARVTAE